MFHKIPILISCIISIAQQFNNNRALNLAKQFDFCSAFAYPLCKHNIINYHCTNSSVERLHNMLFA